MGDIIWVMYMTKSFVSLIGKEVFPSKFMSPYYGKVTSVAGGLDVGDNAS